MTNPAAPWKKSLALAFLALLIGGVAVFFIFSTEPEAKRGGATKKTAMLVDVIEAEAGDFRPTVVATGTVRPEKEVMVSPRISGAVVRRSDDFSLGQFVKEGTLLLQIDPSNYRIALAQRKSDLAQAKTALQLELGQQDLARQEYENLLEGQRLEESEKELVLREPQLASAKEQVSTAEAAVEQARLDLARTTIAAPFDAHVLSRDVDVGAHVQPGMTLGRLVGVDMYWVEASVPLSLRRWLHIPTAGKTADDTECAEVILSNRTSWPKGATRKGCVARMIGAVDEATRMARILIEVKDPLNRVESDGEAAPPLVIGEFLEARIEGIELEGVVRIPRDYLRKGQTVWVARGGKLSIVEVGLILTDAEYAYVDEGLKEGDRIVTTHLSTVTEGAALRFEEGEDG